MLVAPIFAFGLSLATLVVAPQSGATTSEAFLASYLRIQKAPKEPFVCAISRNGVFRAPKYTFCKQKVRMRSIRL